MSKSEAARFERLALHVQNEYAVRGDAVSLARAVVIARGRLNGPPDPQLRAALAQGRWGEARERLGALHREEMRATRDLRVRPQKKEQKVQTSRGEISNLDIAPGLLVPWLVLVSLARSHRLQAGMLRERWRRRSLVCDPVPGNGPVIDPALRATVERRTRDPHEADRGRSWVAEVRVRSVLGSNVQVAPIARTVLQDGPDFRTNWGASVHLGRPVTTPAVVLDLAIASRARALY